MTRGDFKLVTHPEKSPAVDFITRSSQGPFVDTGVDVIMRSQPGMPVVTERVYLSVFTIQHLVQVAGIGGDDGEYSEQREQQLIAIGKLEGMKEGLGGDLVRVADTLTRWLDASGVSDRRSRRS